MMRLTVGVALLLATTPLASSAVSSEASSQATLLRANSRAVHLLGDAGAPDATPPEANDGGAEEDGSSQEQSDTPTSPLDAALASVEQTEDALENARSNLHDKITSVQEASVAVTAGTANRSALPSDYAHYQSTLESESSALAASAESLPDARDATKRARSEVRRLELEAIRKKAEEDAKLARRSEGRPGTETSPSKTESLPQSQRAEDARVPLLQELIQATKDHTAAQTKYAEAALALQIGKGKQAITNKTDSRSEYSNQAVAKAETKETEAHKLLMAPGRAQAQAHCADPVMRVAGFKWCEELHECLQSWENECPGGEWDGQVKKEMEVLTEQLASLREQKVRKKIETMRARLKRIKKVAGIETKTSSEKAGVDPYSTEPKGVPPLVVPAGPGTFGRLKGHVIQLREQIRGLANELKVPTPDDPYAKSGLPTPTAYQSGAGGAEGQGSHMSELTSRLSAVVNEIARTKHGAAMAVLNREADAIMTSLRTMTLGAHCNRCGRGHCDVHPRDGFLWPDLPKDNSKVAAMCGCNSMANPKCPCPSKPCPDRRDEIEKKKCGCQKAGNCPCKKGGKKDCGGPGQPRCRQPPTLCEDPGTPMHSVRLGQTYSEGSKLQFLCQPPYKLVGDEFRTCRADARTEDTPTGDGNGGVRRGGDWTGKQPVCIAPSCGTPDPPIEDGILIGNDFRFPAKIEFKCNEGYTMEGSKIAQCLGSGQWNSPTPRCYPLQVASEGLQKQFEKAQAELDEISSMLGEKSVSQRETDEQKKEDSEDSLKAKEKEEKKKEEKEAEKEEEKEEEEEEAEKEAEIAQAAPEPGSISQLASVAKHAQLELRRAEANRKDVEALVLANSGATSMAEAYGKTAALISSTDPAQAEAAAEKRNKIIQDLLASGSPLYRSQRTVVDENAEKQETNDRAAASAGARIATRFASILLDNLASSQPPNPDRIEEDKEERKQLLAEVSSSASKAAFAEGKLAADEAAAIKAGKVAAAAAAAATLAPVFGSTADQLLKENSGLLEKEIRAGMGRLNGGDPATPAELVASTEEAAINAAEKQEAERKKKKEVLKRVKANAVNDVKKKIEEKLKEADDADTAQVLDKVVGQAESSAADQLEQIAASDSSETPSSDATGGSDLNNVEKAVTSSIADEAVQSILRAKDSSTGTEDDAEADIAAANAIQDEAIGKAAQRVNDAKAEAAEAAKDKSEETEQAEAALDDASDDAVESNPSEQAGAEIAASNA